MSMGSWSLATLVLTIATACLAYGLAREGAASAEDSPSADARSPAAESAELPPTLPVAGVAAVEAATAPPRPVEDARLASLMDPGLDDHRRLRALLAGELRLPPVGHPDRRSLHALLADHGDSDTVRNEVANWLLAEPDDALLRTLAGVIASEREGPRFRSFAVQHLGEALRVHASPDLDEEMRALLRGLLEHHETPSRRQALLSLARLDDPAALRLAEELVRDEAVVDATDLGLRIVAQQGRRELVPDIRRHAQQPAAEEPGLAARIAALHALARLGEAEDHELLQAVQEQTESEAVRDAAAAALQQLDRSRRQEF